MMIITDKADINMIIDAIKNGDFKDAISLLEELKKEEEY